MSLTVCCPGCSTRFKVASEQLQVAQGWVRCGVCRQVFDAGQQLEPVTPSEAVPLSRRQGQSESAEPRPTDRAAPPLLRRASSNEAETTSGFAAFPRDSRSITAAENNVPLPRSVRSKAQASPRPGAAAIGQPSPSFLQPAHDVDRRSLRAWRWSFNLATLLLLVILLAQGMLQHRDALAARAPALKPMVQLLCRQFGCTVGPPRQIGALVIGNSSLTKMGDAGYRLSLALRNRADIELATPGIELTLTDGEDHTLVRRVLMPADLDAPPSIAARGEWAGALMFALTDPRARLAGYRVVAFYP